MARTTRMRTAAAAAALLAGAAMVPAAGAAAAAPSVAVVVQGPGAAAAVAGAGGEVRVALPLVGGVAATVPADAVAGLRASGFDVAPDVALEPTDLAFDGAAVDSQVQSLRPGTSGGPSAGNAVGVALVDTGVAPHPDLAGRVVYAPDFSGEGNTADGYGHGTFMAGLIAGSRTGVAPGAQVVSIKVGRADGSTNLSNVIAGLGWAATHAREYNLRVLNLSFGVDVPMPYQANPLDDAIEAVWATGIAVVTAAGNDGASVTSPGDDPYVITVGATDNAGTATVADDTLASWSNEQRFHGYAKPELLAPGVQVVSLRAPGSTVDTENPQARVEGGYFRGSGTSMATALATGAAAVLAEHHPAATPDDIKGALVSTGDAIAGSNGRAINLEAADNAAPSPEWWQHYKHPFGGTDLEAIGAPRDGMPWTAGRWVEEYWTAGRWVAGRWVVEEWQAGRWVAGRWVAGRWVAGRWVAGRWVAGRWVAGRWVDADWAAGRWAAGRWVDESWTAGRWVAGRWVAGRWVAGRWVAGRWVAGRWVQAQWADEDWG